MNYNLPMEGTMFESMVKSQERGKAEPQTTPGANVISAPSAQELEAAIFEIKSGKPNPLTPGQSIYMDQELESHLRLGTPFPPEFVELEKAYLIGDFSGDAMGTNLIRTYLDSTGRFPIEMSEGMSVERLITDFFKSAKDIDNFWKEVYGPQLPTSFPGG